MSARLTDENQSLHKQIGCMNGIFQIFDRRYFLGGRGTAGRNRKKLLQSTGQNEDSSGKQQNRESPRTPRKHQNKTAKEKQRISTESSRTSFSSTTSCSSSFSSLDNNKTAHLEPPLFIHGEFPGNTAREFPKNQLNNASKKSTGQSLGFRDIVKENIHREAYGISVKTLIEEEAVRRPFKHVDSPRPTRSMEYDGSITSASNESFRVLAKLREAHRNANEQNDISPYSTPKLNRRLSYDGRESSDALKSTIKIRELPRLSLDSRESWAKRSVSGTKSNDIINRNFDRTDDHPEGQSSRRPSTVVAKLMGLESLSDTTTNSPARLISAYSTHELNSVLRLSKMNYENTQTRLSGSPRISHGDSYSPSLKNNHLVMKPNTCQPNRKMDFNEPASETHELASCLSNSLSVYGEIEKRLATLEFTKSGKDLRALKQILEAMQKSRVMLDNKEQTSDFAPEIRTNGTFDHNRSSGASPRHLQIESTASIRAKVSNFSRTNKSPIIIMKPAKNIGKISHSASAVPSNLDASGIHIIKGDDSTKEGNKQVDMPSTKELGLQHAHLRLLTSHSQPLTDKSTELKFSKSTKATKKQHYLGKEISTGSGNSPRVASSSLHKKIGPEKQSFLSTTSSDSGRTKTTPNRKVGSCSTEVKPRRKSPSLNEKSTKLSSKSSICPAAVKQHGNAPTLQSESNRGAESGMNIENSRNSGFDTSNHTVQDGCEQRGLEARLSNRRAIPKITLVGSEQQSPVSVLDSTFYQDDSPSPIKKISYAFEDAETLNPETESDQVLPVQSQKSSEALSAEIKNLKSEIDNLRKHILLVNCNNEELLNEYKKPPSEDMNSQHKYISEILLESGFLKDLDHGLSTIQLHSPGHLINPDIFLALEQSKAVMSSFNGEPMSKRNAKSESHSKVHRKLVFDAVNEILMGKLVVKSSSKKWLPPSKIEETESRGQRILRELCTEVDELQNSNQNNSLNDYDDVSGNMIWKDLMHPSNYWGDYQNNISGIVLDVERLIFKDLITEIVLNESSCLPGFSDDTCRELYQQL